MKILQCVTLSLCDSLSWCRWLPLPKFRRDRSGLGYQILKVRSAPIHFGVSPADRLRFCCRTAPENCNSLFSFFVFFILHCCLSRRFRVAVWCYSFGWIYLEYMDWFFLLDFYLIGRRSRKSWGKTEPWCLLTLKASSFWSKFESYAVLCFFN